MCCCKFDSLNVLSVLSVLSVPRAAVDSWTLSRGGRWRSWDRGREGGEQGVGKVSSGNSSLLKCGFIRKVSSRNLSLIF